MSVQLRLNGAARRANDTKKKSFVRSARRRVGAGSLSRRRRGGHMIDVVIAEKVEGVIRRHLDVAGTLDPSMYFVDDLGADSLALVDLTLALEEAFDIDIQTDDVERLCTVQDAIDYVRRCRVLLSADPS
jgi:acyl carrier protein